jgi:hypothetical protein
MLQIQGVQGRSRSILLRALGNEEMGHPRFSLWVKNMTNLFFVLEVTKSLFAKHAQIYSNAMLSIFFYTLS